MEKAKENILLVDDGPETQLLVKNIIKSLPVNLHIAGTAAEAFRELGKRSYSLVILDIKLPDKDGFAVHLEILKNPRSADIPVIFLTGMDSSTDEFVAKALGARDYVVKPFEPQELLKKIGEKIHFK